MDRVIAMLILLAVLASLILLLLAFFAVAPVLCSCVISLLYTLYLFIAYEGSGVHHAQEFENRFWTIFALLFSTALFFAKDSPVAIGRWSSSIGFLGVLAAAFGMHAYDRHAHRIKIGREHNLRRGISAAASLDGLKALGIPVQEQLNMLNRCLADIDQLFIPSTINNLINIRFILRKEREIISILEEAHPKALNYLIQHLKLGLLFYKVKDHRHFSGRHRTELIELLAVTRLPVLTVLSRVNVLHALQVMRLQANPRSEFWVKNILIETNQDDLSELKSLTDGKGDYFSMNQLIFNEIRSDSTRQKILSHFKKEAAVQQAHMSLGTRKAKMRAKKAWRKILSDIDDTLYCSGGHYPAGIDKRYANKVVYPGVLSLYRELDLGINGPEVWPSDAVGNLVFLSARPHVYKDISENQNYAKFEKLRRQRNMHTTPSLLTGDISSGGQYIVQNDMEPLAMKKFENFKNYVAIYPEFKHIFIGDNGQGDVRAGELMFRAFPRNVEVVYIHKVQEFEKTHGLNLHRWHRDGFKPIFFRTYPDAALDATKKKLIRISGLYRICQQAIEDFHFIMKKQWHSERHRYHRRDELNQGLWRANQFLKSNGDAEIKLIHAEQIWQIGENVKTPYGCGKIVSFDPIYDMYEVEIDWSALDLQVSKLKSSSSMLRRSQTLSLIESRAELDKENDSLENPDDIKPYKSKEGDIEATITYPTELDFIDEKGSNIDESSKFGRFNTEASNSVQINETSSYFADNNSSASPAIHNCAGDSVASDVTDEGFVIPDQNPIETPTVNESSALGRFHDDKIMTPIHEIDKNENTHIVKATLHRSSIFKYEPPVLPTCYYRSNRKLSIFSSLLRSGDKAKNNTFSVGEKCTTPYGSGTILEYRAANNIVVVAMAWKATAYINKDHAQVVSKGIFGNLLRKLSNADEVSVSSSLPKKLSKEFQFAKGAKIKTPFGDGIIEGHSYQRERSLKLISSPTKSRFTDGHNGTEKDNSLKAEKHATTITISLVSWQLANKAHPILYCNHEVAQEWLNKQDRSIINVVFSKLSAFRIKRTHSVSKQTTRSNITSKEVEKLEDEQYYKDGANVSCSFGKGVVRSFRAKDGFYELILTNWVLANNNKVVAYFRKDSLSHQIAKDCEIGKPVLTMLFLSGNLASIDNKTGVHHVVTIPSPQMILYLQPNAILRPLVAAVGEQVTTFFGKGVVKKYRRKDDIYEIELFHKASLFATKYAILDENEKNNDISRKSHWFWKYLLFSPSDRKSKKR